MSKKKKIYAKCPCCKTEKHRTEMKLAISEMEKVDRAQYKHYQSLHIDTYNAFIGSDFDWACDACLASKKAIPAKPGLQNYCWHPHYAYFDSNFVCRTCKTEFTFAKEEKQFWYENLKFWKDSTPINCANCRKESRKLKAENKTISEILCKKEAEINIPELEAVIEIYKNWQKEKSVKYYRSVLRKRKKLES